VTINSSKWCRRFETLWSAFAITLFALLTGGCNYPTEKPDNSIFIFGKRGVDHGHFSKPRAIAIDQDDHLYIVDMTGRIQVFDSDGQFVRQWRTPEIKNGKPCGLGISNDGLVMVADTHYFRVLFYTRDGKPVPERTIGGKNGRGPGEFGFVTDVAQDSTGCYYVSDYGDYDRIQKFDSNGKFLCEWGGHGSESGKFLRPQCLVVDEQDHLWVADSCNHRIQVFDATDNHPSLEKSWGEQGTEPGSMRYPYCLWLTDDGNVFIAEFGNHRIQKFTQDGVSLGVFGGAGKEPGQFSQPWALCLDQQGRVFALDSYNHRVQRFEFPTNTTK
jgi:sugar lactone lactonase YvrE